MEFNPPDNESVCSCFICDKMPSDNLKATYSANKIGLNAEIAKPISLLANVPVCTDYVRVVPNSASKCHVCFAEPQWDKKEFIRSSSILWSYLRFLLER